MTFFPEGGQLVAGLENRVYFVARDSLGKPVQLSGTIVGKGRRDDARDEEVAAVHTTFEGMGAFSLIPQPDESYRLKIAAPTGVKNEPTLPEVSPERDLVLATGSGVFAAEKPLEFNIRAARAGVPLVVAAYCRGVQVGEQPLVTKLGATGANPVAISLDSAVGGVIRLAVYDYSVTPPKLVAQRLVYRRPAHRLNVRIDGVKKRYTPGERLNLTLSATDENGKPAPAALGVAVVDEALLKSADHRTPTVPTYFLLTSEIQKPESLESPDFYLSDETKGKGRPRSRWTCC